MSHRVLLVVCLASGVGGCAGSMPKMASAAMAVAPMQASPPPLDHSVFSRDPNGQLSEDALQKILASPIELDLPSRVGVLPIITATDWRGPGPDYEHVPAGIAPLVGRLRKDAAFTLVTQMMPIPSGALGMEALREVAARYRLRYILLYREVVAKQQHLGPWAVGYATVLGALFLPGQEQEIYGYIETTMFDVKTGLLMFTTRRSIVASQRTNTWHTDEKIEQLATNTITRFAPELATDLLADVRRFASAAQGENLHHTSAQDMVHVPPPGGPTVATDAKSL